MAVVVVTTALIVSAGILVMERSRQLTNPWKEKFMYDQNEVNATFNEISKEIYNQKNEDEFLLGLALVTFLDMLDNPEEYEDEETQNFVHKNADEAAALFRMKYNDEILALNNEDGDGN